MGKRWTLTIGLFVAAAMVLSAGVAQAAWMPQFTGHSVFGTGDPQDSDGTVSFGVYHSTTAGYWGDELAVKHLPGGGTETLSSAGIIQRQAILNLLTPLGGGIDGEYIYFYQVVNTDNIPGVGYDDPDLEAFSVYMQNVAVIKEAGYLSGTVFNDVGTDADGTLPDPDSISEGAVEYSGNLNLGHDSAEDSTSQDTDATDMIPTSSGFVFDTSAGAAAFIDSPGAEMPDDGVSIDADAGGEFVQFGWNEGILDTGEWSTVFYLVTDEKPAYTLSKLEDGNDASSNTPAPVPEPMPLIALLSGLPLVGFGWLRWRRKK